jgi:glycine/D-amino acid oxidase-like deaminating enzyme
MKAQKKTPASRSGPRIAVVGAGAFGGWTALWLTRRGARVTLIDAWGPGNSRASSGGETRVIRAIYGAQAIYTKMAFRALKLWQENERRWKQKLYHHTGALWMVSGQDKYVAPALPLLREAGFKCDQLSLAEARRKYPQISFDGIHSVYFEREAGYLTARVACETVMEAFVAEGGEYRQAAVAPPEISGGELAGIKLNDGSSLRAEKFVFACGPWLGKIFPQLAKLIRATRQDVFFFGTPAGDARFTEEQLPVWVEESDRIAFYGIPGNLSRGFKIADDGRGPEIDPTTVDRVASPERLADAREYIALRFPALKGAPLVEARVCQYEQTPDGNFILDRHPQAANVWIAGGGSGHGFKHGPAVGELLSAMVMEDRGSSEPLFRYRTSS